MEPLTVSLASRPYDGIMPIVRGEASIPNVEIRPTLDYNVPRVFGMLFRGEVDVSEMSLAELIYYTSRGKADFVAVPVFPSRVFRHSFFFCNPRSGIGGPRDLNGRKLGFQRWVQTAGVWMRGTLVDEYGVSPAETQWFVSSTHHWEDGSEEEVTPRDGSVIRRYSTAPREGLEASCAALLDGEVDVIGITENQAPVLLADGRPRRLFEDYKAAEEAYYRRTGIFPIMHLLAMRKSLAAQYPDLPAELFHLFSQSKRLAYSSAGRLPSWSLAWKDRYLEEERATFRGDLWPFGLEANRHVLETFIGYCWREGIAGRQVTAEELFAPSTRGLTEVS